MSPVWWKHLVSLEIQPALSALCLDVNLFRCVYATCGGHMVCVTYEVTGGEVCLSERRPCGSISQFC